MSEKNLDFEIAFIEGIYRRDQQDGRTIELLASLYTSAGRIAEGLALDLQHVRLEPENPTAHYNLACSYSLSGEMNHALISLRTAFEKGFSNVEWMLKDPDLQELRHYPRFHQLMHELQISGSPVWGK